MVSYTSEFTRARDIIFLLVVWKRYQKNGLYVENSEKGKYQHFRPFNSNIMFTKSFLLKGLEHFRRIGDRIGDSLINELLRRTLKI